MPKWIHDRADRILEDNPEMPKSEAFGIATQQAYGTGKQPKKKGWGTPEGKAEAKAKYPHKSEYKKTAGDLMSDFEQGFIEELMKIAYRKPKVPKPLLAAIEHSELFPKAKAVVKSTPKPKPKVKPKTRSSKDIREGMALRRRVQEMAPQKGSAWILPPSAYAK